MHGLAVIVRALDGLNDRVGKATAWLALAMVLMQFVIVVLRYVFSIGFIMMQESIWYLHGILFMVGAGYTLLHNGHVRVDIFYREASPQTKAWIDLLGVLVFLLPVCGIILGYSWSYVINAWKVFEGSTETGGIPLVFALKTVIWVFAILLSLQGISLALRSLLTLLGIYIEPAEEEIPEGV
jgi:TRAP-type mannitol/chloroaromatic compound transport system permease small subunit